MERTELLTKTARASYFHPLRADTPLEVLTVSLDNCTRAPLVRDAVVALWELHQSGAHDVYREAMTAISPWRDNYLYAKDLSRSGFPVIAVEINSLASLEAADAFLTLPLSETVACGKMDLYLRLDVREYAEDVDTVDATLWSRVVSVLERVLDESSLFQLALVELELGIVTIDSEEDAQAMCKLLKLALHGTNAAQAFKVSFELNTRAPSSSFVEAWGPFFQTVCRVDCDGDLEDGNELAVVISGENDVQLLIGFWSAVAFSSGYSRLMVDQNRDKNQERVSKDVVSSYTALALLSQANNITNVEWRRKDISKSEMDAMLQVHSATTTGELSRALRSSMVASSLIKTDLLTKGRAIHDDSDTKQLHVLIPGYGIFRVDRNTWKEGVGDVTVVDPSVFSSSKLTHLHLEMDRYEHDSQLQVARLFPILGASLLILRVDSPLRAALTPEGLLAIFESCPKLRQLLANKFQVPADRVIVDPSRIVSTSLIKLQLLRLSYPNDRLTVRNIDAGEEFFGTVIPLVGSKLEYLELRREKGIIPFSRAFETIVRLCVCLFHFKLECLDVQNLDALIESYREGTSRVSSLYLLKCPVDSTSVVRFAEFLGDRTCPGSKKLGVLHINHTSSDPHEAVQLVGLNATSLKSILAMLEANRSLTELYLGVNDTGVGQIVAEPLRPFKRRFDLYDDEELPAASEQFPINAAVAFVDALQTNNLPWEPEVVKMITTFAAQRVRRSVRYDIITQN